MMLNVTNGPARSVRVTLSGDEYFQMRRDAAEAKALRQEVDDLRLQVQALTHEIDSRDTPPALPPETALADTTRDLILQLQKMFADIGLRAGSLYCCEPPADCEAKRYINGYAYDKDNKVGVWIYSNGEYCVERKDDKNA